MDDRDERKTARATQTTAQTTWTTAQTTQTTVQTTQTTAQTTQTTAHLLPAVDDAVRGGTARVWSAPLRIIRRQIKPVLPSRFVPPGFPSGDDAVNGGAPIRNRFHRGAHERLVFFQLLRGMLQTVPRPVRRGRQTKE